MGSMEMILPLLCLLRPRQAARFALHEGPTQAGRARGRAGARARSRLKAAPRGRAGAVGMAFNRLRPPEPLASLMRLELDHCVPAVERETRVRVRVRVRVRAQG